MDFDQLASSYIPKLVAFVLTPILLPIAGVVANWLQDVAGLDLNGGDLTAYVVAVVAGVGLLAYQWLKGRSQWEVAAAQLQKLHQAGNVTTTGTTYVGTTSTTPPPKKK